MAANNVYRVTYHFEVGGKRSSETFQDNVVASDSTFNSINTVLNNNSKLQNQAGSSIAKTLVIETIGHISANFLS